MTVKATVCIPAFNAGHMIAQTLDSLLAQTYKDFEIIVSDNFSTDDTRDIVKRYAECGVKLVSCPLPPLKTGSALDNTQSAIQNWNSLVNLGNGEYIGIFHADDIYEKDIVQKEVDFLDSQLECSAVFTTSKTFINDDNIDNFKYPDKVHSAQVVDIYNQLELVKTMLRREHFMSSSGPMIRRQSWKKAGKIDAVQFEQACDTEFWIRLAGVGPIGIINIPLVLHRKHLGQDSQNGVFLYHYKPLPIINVLKHAVNLLNVKTRLNEEDYLHLAATCMAQEFRVSLNLIEDGQEKDAIKSLKQLPKLSLNITKILWKDHRRLELARLLLGKFFLFACYCRVGCFFAKPISKSRFGFNDRIIGNK